MAVLFSKDLDLGVKSISRDPESKLLVLDISNSEGGVHRLVTVYTPTGAKRPNLFMLLEDILDMYHPLLPLDDWLTS